MKQIQNISIIYPVSRELELIAERLRLELEHYRIPGNVRQQTGIEQVSDVKDPWLIILCTPETPADPAVQEAIEEFTEKGLYRHILTLLVNGNPEDSFPEALLHEILPDGTVIDHEPLAANITADTVNKSLGRIKIEKLRLLAPILGVSFDELMNRRQRRRMRIMLAAGMGVMTGLLIFLGILLYRVQTFSSQTQQLQMQYERERTAQAGAEQSRDQAQKSYAAAIGTEAEELLLKGDTELAMLLCLEFLPEMDHVPEIKDTLKQALEIRCGSGYIPKTTYTNELPPELPETAEPEESYDFQTFSELSGIPDLDWYTEDEGYYFTNYRGAAWVFGGDPLKPLYFIYNDYTNSEDGDGDYIFDVIILSPQQKYLYHGDQLYRLDNGDWLYTFEDRYEVSSHLRKFSADGYLIDIIGQEEIRVYNPLSGEIKGSFTSKVFPVGYGNTVFAGERDPVNGRCSASSVVCEGILFIYQSEELPVPENLEDQIDLAYELLDGRTLSKEEREQYF